MSHSEATEGMLATDFVTLSLGRVTQTTSQQATSSPQSHVMLIKEFGPRQIQCASASLNDMSSGATMIIWLRFSVQMRIIQII
ncbi:hypothetical protein TNCV_4449841 [Trichonephila clavipes]|nr:hypothetical protein TNCV_4449841 [Trichonephila clavipes]